MKGRSGGDVVIVEAVRTGIGKGHADKGQYRELTPQELLGRVYRGVLDRSGVNPSMVDDVIAGCVQQIGEQGCNVARNGWLHEGLPVEVPATTIDRQCGSGQTAFNTAAAMIAAGIQDIAIAGGVEHMGRVPFAAGIRAQEEFGRAITMPMQKRYGLTDTYTLTGQGAAAERIAEEWALSRVEMDELALRSHQLAHQSTLAGNFAREIIAVHVGQSEIVTDQGIRAEANMASISALPPVFRPDGLVTAATSSQVSDGAAAALLMSRERASELGMRSRARVLDHLTIGVDPQMMLHGPIPATQKILERNKLTIDDIDAIEINEAFAAVVAAWMHEVKPDPDRVNPRGGAMALGHPLGASGTRLITTLLHFLEDEDREFGLVTMCCGGGLGTATLIQRL
ncbi:thiolase family protein [Mycobacterium vicinigordonae]|uniref:Thiolase family protein n=1 Tax=Mycobacterium vicinigordonae TaxID=1719132 RepID=A0A7D6I3P9_9MYCO|nr:thiolase family protein [Mycobacterium vicinigordonae]QLL06158.1 thiolase family protein [Mycobacterium vicinigordonae]